MPEVSGLSGGLSRRGLLAWGAGSAGAVGLAVAVRASSSGSSGSSGAPGSSESLEYPFYGEIQSGITTVKEILAKHYVHRSEAGLVRSHQGKVRLLRPEELPADWDPEDDNRLTAW